MSKQKTDELDSILDKIVLLRDDIPTELVQTYRVRLTDGSVMLFKDEDEMVETIAMLRYDSKNDPIESIECCVNYVELKKTVKRDVQALLKLALKGEGKPL